MFRSCLAINPECDAKHRRLLFQKKPQKTVGPAGNQIGTSERFVIRHADLPNRCNENKAPKSCRILTVRQKKGNLFYFEERKHPGILGLIC
ncbi:hypothetical protein F2P81_026366 [Scophthalmus maximus]|uniref:Uncharacterized protein n=1 Tax=Scophthalmus maximus TaxID=52904 RepID=A0A6A4RPV5_SCOMX|nr:hypothetical protein F2P81_026366 [Scophthalmus maximus]